MQTTKPGVRFNPTEELKALHRSLGDFNRTLQALGMKRQYPAFEVDTFKLRNLLPHRGGVGTSIVFNAFAFKHGLDELRVYLQRYPELEALLAQPLQEVQRELIQALPHLQSTYMESISELLTLQSWLLALRAPTESRLKELYLEAAVRPSRDSWSALYGEALLFTAKLQEQAKAIKHSEARAAIFTERLERILESLEVHFLLSGFAQASSEGSHGA